MKNLLNSPYNTRPREMVKPHYLPARAFVNLVVMVVMVVCGNDVVILTHSYLALVVRWLVYF